MEKYSVLQNIILGLSLAAPIGPVNLEIIKRGLNSGFRQAFLTSIGAMSADATYLTLIFFGLTAFLNIALMKIVLGLGGSFILIYLGFVSAKDFFYKHADSKNRQRRIFKSSFITGYFLAISSPLTIVWWTGVFGALLASQTGAQTTFSAFLSCLSILLGCFLWGFFLAIALHWGKKIINENIAGYISLVAGIFLIAFGIYFLYRTVTLMMN
ncbi:MAG: LysE family translocator [Deltaproteobacteria bacterium]|nr:LysE family translocator [Deltaproteobacteria bacterium]